jgi:hypothetical protein
MVEISFENVAPIAALILISVSIWGAARKFTQLEVASANIQKDIEKNQEELKELKKDYRALYTIVLKLQQQIEDKFEK